MSYKCSSCKRDVDLEGEYGIRCPYCGHRVLLKERSKIIATIDVK